MIRFTEMGDRWEEGSSDTVFRAIGDIYVDPNNPTLTVKSYNDYPDRLGCSRLIVGYNEYIIHGYPQDIAKAISEAKI